MCLPAESGHAIVKKVSVPNSKSEPKQSPLLQLLLCNKPGPVSASITGLLPGTAGGLESLASRVWPYGRVGGWVAGWVVLASSELGNLSRPDQSELWGSVLLIGC